MGEWLKPDDCKSSASGIASSNLALSTKFMPGDLRVYPRTGYNLMPIFGN